jgi:hypothetical protein
MKKLVLIGLVCGLAAIAFSEEIIRDEHGNVIGRKDASGIIRNEHGQVIGRDGGTGVIRDEHGNVIGRH